MVSDELLKKWAYVNCSKYRVKVLEYLDSVDYDMPKNIAGNIGILQNHISMTLSQLMNEGLIECVNPEAHKGRLYRITDEGHEVNSIEK